MNRRLMKLAVQVGCVGLFVILVAGRAFAAPPNIVIFLVDDMGWQDTSVPFHTERTPLNERYHTPNMEALARDGMKFTQAYACSLCSPSRVSLMTGTNAVRHRVTNWTLYKNKSPDNPHALVRLPKWNVNGFSPVAGIESTYHGVALPALLKDAGYRTIHVGKAHFGAKGTPGEDPLRVGFEVNIAGHAAGGPGSYHGQHNFSAAWRSTERVWDVPGLEKYHGQDIHLTEALTLEANAAVKQAVADDKPFFLYMSHYAIHAPFEPDARFIKKYEEKGLKGMAATWASMIEGMDKSLGDIRANLQKLGVADNTIVLFMSDNGSPGESPRNLPLRGQKLAPYEGGIREPMIGYWPGVTKAGSVCDEYLAIEDYFPTILEMAGASDAKIPAGQVDGKSFVPLLKGMPKGEGEPRALYWHFPHNYSSGPFSSIRRADWKLIYYHASGKLELYNIRTDLSEKQNLVAAEPQQTADLAKALADYLRQAKVELPILKQSGAAAPFPDDNAVLTAAALKN